MGRQTRTGFEPTPAIIRSVDPDLDGETRVPKYGAQPDKIIHEACNTVSHSPGWGDSGYRIQVVNHDCPKCSFDRMVRRVDVSPERQNEVRYWCLNPNCVHFVRDHLSHATHGNYPQRDTDSPEVFEGVEDECA